MPKPKTPAFLRLQGAVPFGQRGTVATELGCSASHFSNILHGKDLPGRDLAVRIENRFGIPVAAWAEQLPEDLSQTPEPSAAGAGR